MLSSDEGVDDVFFDSTDCFLSDESVVAEEELGCCGKLDYELWLNEPRSVKERRRSFLCKMGLGESAPENEIANSSEIEGLDRFVECSGAVSSSSVSSVNEAEENLVCCEREMNCKSNCMVDEFEQDRMNDKNSDLEYESTRVSLSFHECDRTQSLDEEGKDFCNKKVKWWKRMLSMSKRREDSCVSEVNTSNPEKSKTNRMKVKQKNKSCMEFTGLYMGQEIQAHKGYIWTIKFSPDGRYLASGGEDGVVRIWRVTSVDASCKSFIDGGNLDTNAKEGKTRFGKQKSSLASIVIPDKVFQIEESPLQEFYGHASDVLDLAWSNSNYLLSCSMDKTVCMWQVGCDQCLNVFQHSNYVTCVQFNPIDDNYFISGSIDGKVRIWGVPQNRVVDWADMRDVISAVCYQPDGKGFVVGSITGTCRFYDSSGYELRLEEELHFPDRKKSSGNRITGIQFSLEKPQRVMITSEDSKLRILEGVDVINKFKGLPKSGSQMSASFTTTGKHIISVGEDCRVYVWNYDGSCFPSSKHPKSVRSCEHFFSEGVSVAAEWSGLGAEHKGLLSGSLHGCSQRQDNLESASWIRDSDRFSIGSCFSMDRPCSRGSATWPEEKLPLWDVSITEDEHHQRQRESNLYDLRGISETWGLVIVAAGCDGTIRTFQNYGLPVRYCLDILPKRKTEKVVWTCEECGAKETKLSPVSSKKSERINSAEVRLCRKKVRKQISFPPEYLVHAKNFLEQAKQYRGDDCLMSDEEYEKMLAMAASFDDDLELLATFGNQEFRDQMILLLLEDGDKFNEEFEPVKLTEASQLVSTVSDGKLNTSSHLLSSEYEKYADKSDAETEPVKLTEASQVVSSTVSIFNSRVH
ncbi:hypothetical protein QYF36_007779 [Acer negundo]|nr:hypothetical protein QYF36_007779 [Acer negundo]